MSPTQKQKGKKGIIIATGFAMFSMFFGAGNVVFPLDLGQQALDQTYFATLGLALSAILIPFTGLMAMMLFDGDYDAFFQRLGKVPGALAVFAILLLIGPGGAMPRLITLSHATIQVNIASIGLPIFSIIACIIIFLFTLRQNRIVDILGYVLTPVLLTSLLLIIALGLYYRPTLTPSESTSTAMVFKGFLAGYNTMDLLGAFFFSHVILMCLKKEIDPEIASHPKRLLGATALASGIGAVLLGGVYGGFTIVAAHYSPQLTSVPSDHLLGSLALSILGPYAGIVATIAVAFACLTTAIALASVFAEYLQKELFRDKIGYGISLIITLIFTFLVSTLGFDGIKLFLGPILQVSYPALIVLSVLNIAHKLWGLKMVKIPVAIVFVISLVSTMYF